MSAWWQDIFTYWGDALKITFDIFKDDRHKYRKIGLWWPEGAQWCYQLDATHVVRLQGESLGPEVRRALDWSLQQARMAYEKNPPQQLINLLNNLRKQSTEQFIQTFNEPEIATEPLPMLQPLPGYLFWLQLTHSCNSSYAAKQRMHEEVEALLDVYFMSYWKTWIDDSDIDSVLIYISYHELKQIAIRLIADSQLDAEIGEITVYTNMFVVQQVAHHLIMMLTSELLLNCKLIISPKLEKTSNIHQVLSGLILTDLLSAQHNQNAAVHIFGESPAYHLLQSLPNNVKTFFLKTAATRNEAAAKWTLLAENTHILETIIQANLNISEAARLLYMHRNTLIHRIERIKLETGYDIRMFSDALTLWLIANMTTSETTHRER